MRRVEVKSELLGAIFFGALVYFLLSLAIGLWNGEGFLKLAINGLTVACLAYILFPRRASR